VLNGTVPRVEVKRDDPQEEDNEPATLRKRKRENLDNLVGELISSAAIKVEPSTDALVPPANPDDLDFKPSLAHVATPDPAEAPMIAPRQSRREPELRKTSLLHATRTNSFAGPSKAAAHTLELDPSLPASVPSAPVTQPAPGGEEFPLIFDGLRFSHLIEEKAAGLEQALIKHGGTLVSEQERLDGEDVDYIIVRL
jgi:DNA replication regulator DPB11